MDSQPQAPRWQTLLAFAIICYVWGSTFLAIRIGVHEVPPFLFAALRFLAGSILFGWMLAKGEPLLTRSQWSSIALIAFLMNNFLERHFSL